jgi:redox-sensitive bicupin YhaK (pirin superfamily)
MNKHKQRRVEAILKGVPAMDGAGVKLTRIIGSPELNHYDPFLLFDVFSSDDAADYIAGFPPHPHRGFETFTWLLEGRLRHEDDAGNGGTIETGGGQWMNAGRGIVHSEMPEQKDGLLKGVQIWINLPAAEKMSAPSYFDLSPENIPEELRPDGTRVRVMAGTSSSGITGPVTGRPTDPLFLDITIAADNEMQHHIPASHNVIAWVADGEIELDDADGTLSLTAGSLALFGEGAEVRVKGIAPNSRFLLAAGKRLDEPVARGGPFVMNTKAEVAQAFADFEAGALGGGFYIPRGTGDTHSG